jgi:hypothetical protein
MKFRWGNGGTKDNVNYYGVEFINASCYKVHSLQCVLFLCKLQCLGKVGAIFTIYRKVMHFNCWVAPRWASRIEIGECANAILWNRPKQIETGSPLDLFFVHFKEAILTALLSEAFPLSFRPFRSLFNSLHSKVIFEICNKFCCRVI